MKENIYIIIDFDHTITSKDSKSSWSVLDNHNIMPSKEIKICKHLMEYYLPIEKDIKIPLKEKEKLMEQWYIKHLNILIKNKIRKEDIEKVICDKKSMNLRKGAQSFFKYTYNQKIPVIIISAGIANVIESFLKANNCLYDNIFIISNTIEFKNGIIKGFKNKIIHSLNKNKIALPDRVENTTKNRQIAILIGDNIGDILMAPKDKKTIKIAFTNNKEDFKAYFDIMYGENQSLEKIIEIIKDIV